jgi:hypothetical protein
MASLCSIQPPQPSKVGPQGATLVTLRWLLPPPLLLLLAQAAAAVVAVQGRRRLRL